MSLTALVFLSLYLSGLVLAFVRRPIFGLYAYLLSFYLHPVNKWWGNDLPGLRWVFIAALVTMIAIVIKREKKNISWLENTETKLFTAFTLFVAIQYIWALRTDLHMEYVILCVKFLLLIFIIQRSVLDKKDVIGFIIVNLIGCAYIGYQGFGGGRLEGMGIPGLNNSNQLAQHMSVVLVFSSFLLLLQFGKKGLLLYPLIILVLNGIILAESRSVIIALAATGLFAVIFPPVKARKKLYFFAFLGVVAFAMLLGPRLVEKMSTIAPDENAQVQQDSSARSRLAIIKAQIDMFKDNPILGYGHRGTLLLSPGYLPEEYLSDRRQARASHNFIMTLFVDHGLLGAMLYLAIIIFCIKKVFKLKSLQTDDEELGELSTILSGFVASLICLLVAGLGSNNKVLEVDIWLYAFIPMVFNMIQARVKKIEDKVIEANALSIAAPGHWQKNT